MAYTDRELLKQQQAGAFATSGATDPIGEVNKAHRNTYNILKIGIENAATAVAEVPGFILPRKSKIVSVKLIPNTTATQSTTVYDIITVSKRNSSGGAKLTIATWNTHNSAQGTLTALTPGTASFLTNSDAVIAAGSFITYEIAKTSTGTLIDPGLIISLDMEEV